MSSINHAVEMIKSICGSLLNSKSNWERHRCARCQLPLTDYASVVNGIGPICANKNTALFAKTIKANYVMVLAYSDSVDIAKLPSITVPVWNILKDNVIPAMSAAMKSNPDLYNFFHDGNDTRGFIRIIDWILSFPGIDGTTRKNLIEIVRQLGYVAVASVLEGKASTGESKIWFDTSVGMLCLTGSSCKPGYAAIKKLNGSTVPKYRGDKTPYRVPAKYHEEFLSAAMTYWPCFEEKAEDVVVEALNWLATRPAEIIVNNPTKSSNSFVRFLEAKDGVEFTMVWEKDRTYKVVADIKTIPYNHRKYKPNTKSWFISDKYKTRAEEILKLHYGEGM